MSAAETRLLAALIYATAGVDVLIAALSVVCRLRRVLMYARLTVTCSTVNSDYDLAAVLHLF